MAFCAKMTCWEKAALKCVRCVALLIYIVDAVREAVLFSAAYSDPHAKAGFLHRPVGATCQPVSGRLNFCHSKSCVCLYGGDACWQKSGSFLHREVPYPLQSANLPDSSCADADWGAERQATDSNSFDTAAGLLSQRFQALPEAEVAAHCKGVADLSSFSKSRVPSPARRARVFKDLKKLVRSKPRADAEPILPRAASATSLLSMRPSRHPAVSSVSRRPSVADAASASVAVLDYAVQVTRSAAAAASALKRFPRHVFPSLERELLRLLLAEASLAPSVLEDDADSFPRAEDVQAVQEKLHLMHHSIIASCKKQKYRI